jgi:putative membrane protein
MAYVLIKYVHFVAIIFLSACLTAEHIWLKMELTRQELNKLARLDLIYGLSAAVVIIAGVLMWFVVGKPSAFYSQNPLFHLKLGLFLLMGLLSIHPTLFLLKNRKADKDVIFVPRSVVNTVRVEMAILLLLPLLAVLMANGYGLN